MKYQRLRMYILFSLKLIDLTLHNSTEFQSTAWRSRYSLFVNKRIDYVSRASLFPLLTCDLLSIRVHVWLMPRGGNWFPLGTWYFCCASFWPLHPPVFPVSCSVFVIIFQFTTQLAKQKKNRKMGKPPLSFFFLYCSILSSLIRSFSSTPRKF